MARMRSIKPEMFRSLTVSSWPVAVRWTLAGLLTYLDDAGRGLDDTRLIKAEIYPVDDAVTARKLEKHLQAIAHNGPLCRYRVGDRSYIHITSWDEHQSINRPRPSRIPPCPIHEPSVNGHGGRTASSPTHPAPISEPSLPRAHPPAQASVPAEQGAGSREQGGEQGTRGPSREPDASASDPPPPRCPKHINDPNPPACGQCGDARRARERWDADQAAAKAALAAELDQARADPRLRCHHGTDGGRHRRSDTGAFLCALCRSETRAEQDRSPA